MEDRKAIQTILEQELSRILVHGIKSARAEGKAEVEDIVQTILRAIESGKAERQKARD